MTFSGESGYLPNGKKVLRQENRWQASVRAEAVQAECFFPDFSVSDPWGMKTKQFVIRQAMEGEAEEQDGDKDQMELVIASDLQGFTMEQEGV